MPEGWQLPDLTFPMVKLGRRETPWDLKPLLYRGGAAANVGKVAALVRTGELGVPQFERLKLVQSLHESITGKLVGGGSKTTQASTLDNLRAFFAWAEDANHPLTLETVAATYLHWTDALLRRVRVVKDITKNSAYTEALRVSGILDLVLLRSTPLIQLSRLDKPPKCKTVHGVKADKQNLEWTFSFGHMLQDICDNLSISAIWGPLPVVITLRSGNVLEEWSKLKPADTRISAKRDTESRRNNARVSDKTRAAHANDRTLRTRYPLTNLRVEAELLMFIGQTGMNLGQAYKLKLRNFFFSSDIDGYKVKDRKSRRGGEVLFEIYKEYRAHFERYLDWRREIFPEDERLFPFVTQSRSATRATPFSRIRTTCKKLGLSYIAPSVLRKTRINWLLRRSGDPDLTAEMAQHTKETLLTVYEEPSLQRAMGEIMRFWAQSDPALVRTTPVAPGECNGTPAPVKNIPNDAPTPDCIRASGCLWCEHHRDIDTQDYVWSLGCFRHLKIIELSKYRAPEIGAEKHPAEHAVNRLSDKLGWFRQSNELRKGWVEETLARIEEGNYHPDWVRLIEDEEGRAS
ncbi:hypothetical protein [uncultured Dechloromonas sp.]|uniref:hypothetical protein n=1 Tax=uncultured Dechloromonas sp. TaxID=171719 RepID=UPI0025DF8831|nr:hypothetical protein [uncultured Dechloromonas sp.]